MNAGCEGHGNDGERCERNIAKYASVGFDLKRQCLRTNKRI